MTATPLHKQAYRPEERGTLRGIRILRPHADVDRLVVEQQRELRLVRCLRAVLGEPLREPALVRHSGPRLFVEFAVDRHRARTPCCVRAHAVR